LNLFCATATELCVPLRVSFVKEKQQQTFITKGENCLEAGIDKKKKKKLGYMYSVLKGFHKRSVQVHLGLLIAVLNTCPIVNNGKYFLSNV
jgi:hypothetical protein